MSNYEILAEKANSYAWCQLSNYNFLQHTVYNRKIERDGNRLQTGNQDVSENNKNIKVHVDAHNFFLTIN